MKGTNIRQHLWNNSLKDVDSVDNINANLLVLLFVALWFILRGDLFYVLPCGILFLCLQSF